MKLCYIDVDEWYPIYTLSEETFNKRDKPMEFTDEEYQKYEKAMQLFEEIQDFICNKLHPSKPKK